MVLMMDSEARKASYWEHIFLTSFLFLLSFLRSSMVIVGIPAFLAISSCWRSQMMAIL